MKKLLILLSLILILASCGRAAEPTEVPTEADLPAAAPPATPVGDENTFYLDALPDIGEYDSGEPKRWYEEYTPEFIPRDDYGLLLPYAGERRVFYEPQGIEEDFAVDRWKFGLCTEDGRVVTDAVYDYITDTDAGQYLLTRTKANETDPYSEGEVTAWVAAADGSYCTELFRGEGFCYYIGGGVYTVSRYSWMMGNGQRYYSCDDGVTKEVMNGYDGIYYESGYFVGFDKKDDFVILDSSFNELIKMDASPEIVNEDYFIFSSLKGGERLSGLARLPSGEVVLEQRYEYLGYAEGCFYSYDGETFTTYNRQAEPIDSFTYKDAANVFSDDGRLFTFADKNYDAVYYTADGRTFGEGEHVYDYSSGYHIFNGDKGATVYDEELNEVCLIPDERLYSAVPTEGGILIATYSDEEYAIYKYYSDSGKKERIYQLLDGVYTTSLGQETDTHRLMQVYSYGGKPLFRSYGSFTYSDTVGGRLYHYVSNGKVNTCREDGRILLSIPVKE